MELEIIGLSIVFIQQLLSILSGIIEYSNRKIKNLHLETSYVNI